VQREIPAIRYHGSVHSESGFTETTTLRRRRSAAVILEAAFGPIVSVLGLAIMLNAGVGLGRSSRIKLQCLWLTDGLLKVTDGVMLIFGVA
jgi:hypothetical protein